MLVVVGPEVAAGGTSIGGRYAQSRSCACIHWQLRSRIRAATVSSVACARHRNGYCHPNIESGLAVGFIALEL
jgi:hypothetical protein